MKEDISHYFHHIHFLQRSLRYTDTLILFHKIIIAITDIGLNEFI